MRFPSPLVSAALVALSLVLLAGVAVAFRGGGEPPRGWLSLPPPLPREWRFEREPLSFDFMIQKPEVPAPKLEDMYARRR